MRAAGRHTVPPLILKRVRRPPPDPDSTSQTRQPPSTMRPALPCSPGNRRPPCDQPHLAAPAIAVRHATSPPCRPGNRRPPVMPPFSIQAQPLPHGAGGPHAKQTVVSRPRRPSTAKRGRGDSRKGPQLAGVAEGRGAIGRARSRIRQGCGWQDPQPESRRVTGTAGRARSQQGSRKGGGAIGRPAAVSGRDPQGVRQSFSQALYHLQA